MNDPIKKGRYQITKNVFATCYLDVIEANSQETQILIGLKKRGDNQVPVGTRIFMDIPASLEKAMGFDTLSVTVLKVEQQTEKLIHWCTPIQKAPHPERRQQARKPVDFPVLLVDSQTLFTAINGTPNGLELVYAAQRAMLKLTLSQTYSFKFNCKGEDCSIQGIIKHIQYDWQSFQHRVGVHFPNLSKDEQIFLNIMVDPNYVVPISNKQSIDTGAGKISTDD